MKNSVFVLLLALIVLAFGVSYHTNAWLFATDTAPVLQIDDATITLNSVAASTGSHKMLPGQVITIGSNGPKVTVPANTLPCYVFIKPVTTEPNSVDFFTFAVDSGFTRYSSSSSYYYKEVAQSTSAQTFNTIATVTIDPDLTNANISSISDTAVKLTVKACAVQSTAHTVAEAYATASTVI